MIYVKGALWGKHKMPTRPYTGLFGVNTLKTIFTVRRRVKAAVAEGICVYNEGYLFTITQLQPNDGVSPSNNTAHHAERKGFSMPMPEKQRSTENASIESQ